MNWKIKISVRSLIMFFVFLNPVLALFFDKVATYRYILEPVVTLLLVLESTKSKKRFYKNIIIIFFTGLSVLYAVAIGADKAKLYLHLFCYLNAIFFFYFIIDRANQKYVLGLCRSKVGYLKALAVFISIIEVYMMVTGRGYTSRFKWGGTFFQGTSSMPHTMSYLMLVVIAIDIIIVMTGNKKIWALVSVVPFLAIFQSGARISIVLGALLLMIIIDQVLTSKQKSVFFKVMAVVIVVGIGLFIFRDRIFNSSLWAKITIRSGGSYELTAGRTIVWADMIDKYLHNSNVIEYLIGRGDDKTYYYNSINPLVRNPIWAHSDYLQILVGKGAAGLWFYSRATFVFFRTIVKQNKNVYKWMIILLILIAGVLNGFYSYRDTTMAIPLFAVIGLYYGEEKVQDGTRV